MNDDGAIQTVEKSADQMVANARHMFHSFCQGQAPVQVACCGYSRPWRHPQWQGFTPPPDSCVVCLDFIGSGFCPACGVPV